MKIKQIVYNPNFWIDVKEIFNLSMNIEEIKNQVNKIETGNPLSIAQSNAGDLSYELKLITFIDRVEFIKHLKILSEHAKNKNFVIDGHEVNGVDWDINALRLYLSLTCIDIFFNASNHKEHFDIVFDKITEILQRELTGNLKIIENNVDISNIKEYALFFYNIRNSYTHAGIRFHSDGTKSYKLNQEFVVGTSKNKTTKELQIEKGYDLTDLILRISIENAKSQLGF